MSDLTGEPARDDCINDCNMHHDDSRGMHLHRDSNDEAMRRSAQEIFWQLEIDAVNAGKLPGTGAGTPWPPKYTWKQRRLRRRLVKLAEQMYRDESNR